MQYGSAAGVWRPSDDILDILMTDLRGLSMLRWVLRHQARQRGGSLGGETRDMETSTGMFSCGCGSVGLGSTYGSFRLLRHILFY